MDFIKKAQWAELPIYANISGHVLTNPDLEQCICTHRVSPSQFQEGVVSSLPFELKNSTLRALHKRNCTLLPPQFLKKCILTLFCIEKFAYIEKLINCCVLKRVP